jgi:hypothetical protein
MTNKQVSVIVGVIFVGLTSIACAIVKQKVDLDVIQTAKTIYEWLKTGEQTESV